MIFGNDVLQTAAGMPHGYCFLWHRDLIALHAVSDTLIAGSYFTIPATLAYFVRQRRDVPFSWMFVCFGVFILACGLTHAFSVYNIWVPSWWLSGGVKAVTALASLPTAVLLGRLVPQALALPSPAQLATANAALSAEVARRETLEAELRAIQQDLERRVEERSAALERAQQQLAHSQKMEAVGRLAGGIAHDFNNLLTVIIAGSMEAAQRLEDRPDAKEALEEIQSAGERAARLTGQLLAFSRRQPVRPEVLDAGNVIRDLERLLDRLLGERIDLDLVLADEPLYVTMDHGQLDQVLVNLVVNARDAMPDGGRITIETSAVELDAVLASERTEIAPGSYVMLAVTDRGQGMDPLTQARLFEPFFTTKEPGKGTGLGLATVYGVVKQAGGGIYVYSEPGVGSSFKIYLPRTSGAGAVARPADPGVAQVIEGGSETVLLVEDDQAVRRQVAEMLRARGYDVVEAEGAEPALELLRGRGAVDLLLTDIVLRGTNGPELAQIVTRQSLARRVLFMSGYAEAAVHEWVLAGGWPFLAKPFTPAALSRKVRDVLDAWVPPVA